MADQQPLVGMRYVNNCSTVGWGRGGDRRGNSLSSAPGEAYHPALSLLVLFFKAEWGLLIPVLLTLDAIPLPLLQNKVGQLMFLGTILTKYTQLKISRATSILFFSHEFLLSLLGEGTV